MKTLVTLLLVLGLVGFTSAQELDNPGLDAPRMGVEVPWTVDHALKNIFGRWGDGWLKFGDWEEVSGDFDAVRARLQGIWNEVSPAEFAEASQKIDDAFQRIMGAAMN